MGRRNNIRSRTIYHEGQYISNAEKYSESVVDDPESDLNNIDKTYLEPGGAFFVLVDGQDIVGMAGLQLLPNQEGEIRRNYLKPAFRGQGWGSKMCRLIQDMARQKGLRRLICSTPEHGEDVLRFYGRLEFSEFGERCTMHGTPIKEVFLEWKVVAEET